MERYDMDQGRASKSVGVDFESVKPQKIMYSRCGRRAIGDARKALKTKPTYTKKG